MKGLLSEIFANLRIYCHISKYNKPSLCKYMDISGNLMFLNRFKYYYCNW